MLTNQLVNLLNEHLNSHNIQDYCPNGLQVEGCEHIRKIITGVTASQALIDAAIAEKADAILVHHGYFWKGEAPNITGMKKQRIAKLLKHNINLLAYHLPIDVHNELGNNAQLGHLLGCNNIQALPSLSPSGIVMFGELPQALSHSGLSELLKKVLAPNTVVSVGSSECIQNIAWCTGGGQNYIDAVAKAKQDNIHIDAFISGEISEQTTHSAIEQGLDFFAAGHHATERYGIKALGEWLQAEHQLDVSFIDIPNRA